MNVLLPPIRIERLSHGGEGVGALPSGKRVFVPATAPGDVVEIEPVEERRAFVRARLLRVVEPGPDRIEPACPHAARCGGCQLLHLDTTAQLRAKEEAFYGALERIAGLPRERIERPLPIVAAPADRRYRVRARLHVRRGRIGFLRRATHELEAIGSCLLLDPKLERLVFDIAAALRTHPLPALREIDACVGEEGGAIALHPAEEAPVGWADGSGRIFEGVEGLQGIVAIPPPSPAPRTRRRRPPGPAPAPVVFGNPVLSRPAPLAPGVRLFTRPDLFAQAHAGANEALVRAAVEGLAPTASDQVLELHAGAGNFTFALARRSGRVVAVEFEGGALDLARRSAAEAGVENVRFVGGDAERVATGFALEGRRFDLVLLDPPRTGAKGVADALVRLGPRRIAWVSCDPATLARDLAPLLAAGYRVDSAVPIDMFPQTYHVEGVVLLERA